MTRWAAFVAALTAAVALWTTTGSAHPLNVYVQVAEIEVTRTALMLQLRLTPGVNVADSVVAEIDGNRDGAISSAEQAAYADRVRRDVTLKIDGHPAALQLRSSSFATVGQMAQGLGDIVLVFAAPVAVAEGPHRVTFENHHHAAIAAYLVNALESPDRDIRAVGQQRSYDQSRYQLDVQVTAVVGDHDARSRVTPAPPDGSGRAAVVSFFWPGVRHILTGYDHLLFLAALVLGAASLWDLVKVVTVFTFAHSITLTLAALGLVHVSPALVEPVIAASIVAVAMQNVFWPARSRGASRLAAAFVFGLFHGLGFAGGLLDVMHQLPPQTMLFAIVGFSAGVEAGNQLVLVPLFAALWQWRQRPTASASSERATFSLPRLASAVVSAAGVYYLALALVAG